MNDQQTREGEVTVELRLEIDRMLFAHLEPGAQQHVARAAIEAGVADLMRVLGVPGTTAVTIAPLSQREADDPRWLRLRVNSRVCRYGDALILAVESYLRGQLFAPNRALKEVLKWLDDQLSRPD